MGHPSDASTLAAAFSRDTQTAIILADAGGNIVFWNAGAEVLFGHSADDAAGHRVDLIVPHELRDLHWGGFNRTIGSTWRGHEGWGDIDALHKSGEPVRAQVLLTPIYGTANVVESVFAMFRRRAA